MAVGPQGKFRCGQEPVLCPVGTHGLCATHCCGDNGSDFRPVGAVETCRDVCLDPFFNLGWKLDCALGAFRVPAGPECCGWCCGGPVGCHADPISRREPRDTVPRSTRLPTSAPVAPDVVHARIHVSPTDHLLTISELGPVILVGSWSGDTSNRTRRHRGDVDPCHFSGGCANRNDTHRRDAPQLVETPAVELFRERKTSYRMLTTTKLQARRPRPTMRRDRP